MSGADKIINLKTEGSRGDRGNPKEIKSGIKWRRIRPAPGKGLYPTYRAHRK